MEEAFISQTPSRSAQRILTGLATLAIMMVLYGSWLPFEFDTHLRWPLEARTLRQLTHVSIDLEDAVTNFLIYVPIGLFLSMRLLLTARRRVLRLAAVLVIAAACIIVAEGGQLLMPRRQASCLDMAWNLIGTVIGMALAPLALRWARSVVRQLELALALRPMRALFWIVATLVVFAKLAPFDFAIMPADLERSILTARWSPFDEPILPSRSSPEHMVEMAGSFFAFVLLGVFGALSLREAGLRRSVCAVNTIAKLILLAIFVELVQLLIVSHTCDAADMVTHVYGAAVGAILGATVIDTRWRDRDTWTIGPAGQILLMAALVIQCVIIVGYAIPTDAQWVAPSERSIQWIPFYGHFQESFAVGTGQIISSFLWYATLAVIAAAMVSRRNGYYTFVMAGLLTVGVVTLTEAIQAFNVSRYADVTEPLLALMASIAATAALRWVQRHLAARPQVSTVDAL